MDALTTDFEIEQLESHAARNRFRALIVSMLCYGCLLLALLASSHILG